MSGRWLVKAIELFGAPGEGESTDVGLFAAKEAAIAGAMAYIRESIDELARDAASVEDLISRYESLGENAIIYSVDSLESVDFSGVDHAKRIAREVFQNRQETAIADEIRAAYRDTNYVAILPEGEAVIRIGQRNPAVEGWLKDLGKRSALFLSAWNPMSKLLTAEENAARHADLLGRVVAGGWPCVEAEGRSPAGDWSETSLLIAGISLYEADPLAKHFEQAGYVWIEPEKPASLRIRTLRNTWVEEADVAFSSEE